MASTPFRALIDPTTTYTVPTGKMATFIASLVENSNVGVVIGGVLVGRLGRFVGAGSTADVSDTVLKPLTAAAGQVISMDGGAGKFAIVGLLSDV